LGSPLTPQPTRCKRGWWFSRRVLAIQTVSIGRPAVHIRQAVACENERVCALRAQTALTRPPTQLAILR